ncbi:MAG TPA: lysophospholipid acyltransferase family protein [Candidatus Polarisedimenticolia bacterium]|nr:lysophospholipid acyltransferase family protein [Candidatus Polarisedimenticolia bacterium]
MRTETRPDPRTPLRRLRHLPQTRGVRHALSYLLCRALLTALGFLPRRAGLGIGRACGLLFHAASARHRRIARANLERAFGGDLTPRERERLARASFAHAGMIMADAAYFGRIARHPLDRVAVFEGTEHLRAAASGKRGVLVFSGHFGHWELIGLLQPRLGVPFSMVVRPLDNGRLDAYLAGLRKITGNELISKYDAARGVLRALRPGRAVGLMIDQNVRGDGGLFVQFFGAPASTTPALATFALKSGAPIVPVFSYPLPDGRFLVRYGEPIVAARRGTLAEDIFALTQQCTTRLEDEIRRRPDCWLWMHNRWRTQRTAAAPPAAAAATEPGHAAATPSAAGRATTHP